MPASPRSFRHSLWYLVRPYWQSSEKWASGGLLATVVALNLGAVYVNVQINEWNNLFYNALQDKDRVAFGHQIIRFCILAGIFLVVAVYRFYLRQMLQIRWRRWLTEHFSGAWLKDGIHYRLRLAKGTGDNPDQRIADDIGAFVSQTLGLGLGLLESTVSLFSFAVILWGLSGPLTLWGVGIPGYLLWVAIVYALAGTWLIHRIGRPLIGLNFAQQRLEADFRFSLVRVRENGEAIALYGGEREERRRLQDRFAEVVGNWWRIMRRQKRLTWFSAGYGQIAVIFPYLVVAPRFFSGAIELGGMMQTASAFGEVQGALSWFIDAYASLAEWKATADRLIEFQRDIEEAGRNQEEDGPIREAAEAPSRELRVSGLSIRLPDHRPLLENLSASFPAGSRTLITGPSGCGKSTLFRTIAGLWPWAEGRIRLPPGGRTLFLPQQPYLPIGRLSEALAYPDPAALYEKDEMRRMLVDCALGHLVSRLDETRHWSQVLSPGEQQRLAFARALLLKPDWLFLDEATSAVEEGLEIALYALLAKRLPACAVISIAHHPALAAIHDRHLTLGFTQPG